MSSIYDELKSGWDSIRSEVESAGGSIMDEGVMPVVEGIEPALEEVSSGMGSLTDEVLTEDVVKGLIGAAGLYMGGSALSGSGGLGGTMSGLWDNVGGFLGSAWDKIGDLGGGGGLLGDLGGLLGGGDDGLGGGIPGLDSGGVGDIVGPGGGILPGISGNGGGSGFLGGMLDGGIGDLLGAGLGYMGAQDQEELSEEQMQMMLDYSDPYHEYRAGAAEDLEELRNDPDAILESDIYQASRDEGLEAVNREMAASGNRLSGRRMDALDKTAMADAERFYSNEFNRRAQLAGATQQPAAAGGLMNPYQQRIGQSRQNRWNALGYGLSRLF